MKKSKEGSALSGPREGEVPALDTGTEPPVVTQPDVTDVAGATGTLLPGRLVDTGDPRPESPLAKRRELLADDAGRLVTLVYESAYRSPIVETVRLHRFHLVTSTWRDEVTASLDITQQDSVRPRRRKRYSIDRKMPSPIMVIEGAVGIEPWPCPDERRLFDDWDVFRDVWEDVAAQARVAGRPVLFDSVAVTVEHEMQEIPRRNAENAAREAFCREAGWEELP